ncbi:MAG: PaaI family thioesterase [Firmicutes bacterium]|nr:PaaI family thioesterase [Bacillota bacterium]
MTGRLKVPLSPYLELLEVEIVEIKYPRAKLTLNWAEKLTNPMGTLHGGIIATMIDAVLGFVLLNKEDVQAIATVELKVNYFKAITEGTIVATGEIVYQRGSTAFGQTRIHQGKELIALGSATYKLSKKNC